MKKQKVTQEINLMELFSRFGSEDKCRIYLEALRFPNGIKCTRCASDKISRIAKRNQFMCDGCKYQFSPMAGTMFHDTHLPLVKWFAAVYLMCESKKGISANQLSRTLKMSYKTAWYLTHRIREALKTDENSKLSDTIEVDETFVGGKLSNKHGEALRRAKTKPNHNKLITVGALQRNGEIRLKHIPDTGRPALHTFIRSLISRDTKQIYTDDRTGYRGIDWETGIKHFIVNHSKGEYVLPGGIHTNGIENVFSLFKRSIVGSFHHLSEQHIDRYLDEFEFKFSNRNNPYMFRDCILRLLNAKNMEYKTLIEKN